LLGPALKLGDVDVDVSRCDTTPAGARDESIGNNVLAGDLDVSLSSKFRELGDAAWAINVLLSSFATTSRR